MGLSEQQRGRRLREAVDRAIRGGRAGAATPATDSRASRARGRSMMECVTPYSINSPAQVHVVALYGRSTYGNAVYWRPRPG